MTVNTHDDEIRDKIFRVLLDGWTDKTSQATADQIMALLTKHIREARIEAYADCGSKGGTGTVVRAYAKSRANEYQKLQQEGEAK